MTCIWSTAVPFPFRAAPTADSAAAGSLAAEAVGERHGRACEAPGAPAGRGLEVLVLLAVDAGRGRRGFCVDIMAASVSRLQLTMRARVHGHGCCYGWGGLAGPTGHFYATAVIRLGSSDSAHPTSERLCRSRRVRH
jgi:hypothetical protein